MWDSEQMYDSLVRRQFDTSEVKIPFVNVLNEMALNCHLRLQRSLLPNIPLIVEVAFQSKHETLHPTYTFQQKMGEEKKKKKMENYLLCIIQYGRTQNHYVFTSNAMEKNFLSI